jgi:hypothetical protein
VITYANRWTEIQRLLAAADHIQLKEQGILAVARALAGEVGQNAVSFTDDPRTFPNESPATNDDDTLEFLLLLGAMSFCIWRRDGDGSVRAWSIAIDGQEYVGARGLAAALVRAQRGQANLLDASVLQGLTLADVQALFRDEATGETSLQMLVERVAKLNELGAVLSTRYGGLVRELLARGGNRLYRPDGEGVIQQLLTHFPLSFGDWPFAKLAQLTVKFVVGRRRPWIPTTPAFERVTRFDDLADTLDASADYYIPLFFLRVGLFEADERLLAPLRQRQVIAPGSLLEQGYRAATLEMCRRLALTNGLTIADLDTLVWKQGYLRCRVCRRDTTDGALFCPHRPHCRAVREPALFDLAWPLVYTTWY